LTVDALSVAIDTALAETAERVSPGDRLVIVLRDTGWLAADTGDFGRHPLLDSLKEELRRVGLFDRTVVLVVSNPADEVHVVRGGQ
jgi:hypothetical protein